MSDFLDTQVGSMNFKPPPRPKDGPTKPSGNTTPPPPSTTPGSYNLNGQPIWGTSGGIVYQYGRDSTGRDTFGPGTDEAGNPLGNQDGTMIGSQDPRYGAAQAALAQHPGYVQVRVDQQGMPGGYNDPSQLVYDPTVGLITPQANIVMGPDHTGAEMLAVMLGGPLLGAAGNAVFGAGEVIGPVAEGAAGGAGAVAAPVGATGVETVPEVVGPDGTMLPPGGPELTGPPVASPPIADPTVAPPPGADLQIPPPMEPVTAPTLDPMVPYTPAGVADGLTPGINDAITLPPEFQPSPGGGLDYSPTLPGTPDFNVPPYSPPNVDVPPPDFTVDQPPWWQAGMDAVTSHPLQAAGLGISAFNAFNRPKPPTIDSHIPDTNKPVIDQAISDIMHKGALSGDQQHSIDGIIDQHIREGVEAINQRAINSGMGANSMVTQQQINQFKQNAEVARAQLYQQQMQQNISNAIQVWAEGNREDIAIQTAAANLAMQNNQEVARLNQSIAQSLGWLYSMSNSRSAPSTFPGG